MPTIQDITEKEEVKEIAVPEATLSDFIQDRLSDIERVTSERTPWALDMSKWYRWRKGLEGAKPDLTKPWRNSSAIHYRRSEKVIREFKATGVTSVMQSQRLTRFIHPSESADKMENYFEYELRTKLNWADICTAELDVLGEKGLLITKQVWRVENEPRTETCERSKMESALGMAMQQKLVNPMTGQPDFSKIAKTKTLMDGVNKLLTKQEQRQIIAGVCGYPYGMDADDDKGSAYERRIDSILKQLATDEETIEYIEDREVYNGFDVSVIRDPNMVLWGPRKATDIQDAEWVLHKMRYSERAMLKRSKTNGGPWKNVPEILRALSGADDGSKETAAKEYPEETYVNTSKNLYEGVQSQPAEAGMVNVWELSCFVPRKWIRKMDKQTLEDGDTMVPAILTFCPDVDVSIGVMRLVEHPYKLTTSRARWNYCSHTLNKGAGDLYSGEGWVKLVNPYESAYNTAQNALSDRNTVAINPWILKRGDIGLNDNQLRAFPSIITVNQPNGTLDDAVKVVPFPNLGFFATEVQQYASAADEIAGRPNLSGLNNYGAPPTAEQVQQLSAPAGAVSQFELLGYHEFKARQYRQLYDLLWQFKGENMSPEGETVSVPDQKGKTVTLTAQDFKPDFAILSGTDILRDNPVLAAQKRIAGAQMLLGDPRLAPYFNMPELVNLLINDNFGYLMGSRISVTMDEAQKNAAQMENLKAAAMQAAAAEGEQLTKKAKKNKSLANAMPVQSGPMEAGGGMGNQGQGMFTGGMMQ